MNIQEQETTIKAKRLQYAIDNNCIGQPGYKDMKVVGGAGNEKITAIGKKSGKKYEFTVYDKPVIIPNMGEVHGEVKNMDSKVTKYWKCKGMFDISDDTTPPPIPTPNDDDDDNGGDDNSPTTNWKSNFCIACTDSEGSALSTRRGGLCKPVIEGGGICTKFKKSDIVNDFPTLKNISGETQSKIPKDSLFSTNGELFLQGESRVTNGENKPFKLKKENGEWYFYDDEKEGGQAGWIKLSEYFTTSLHENKLFEQKEMKSISDKIEEKLRDIYFYTVSEKGKERVMFDLQDKKSIEQHLKDLHSQNIVGDRGFVMAVVRAKGSDKEDGQLIKLGSYPKDSNVNLGFGEEKGLGGLVGTQYFSIKNNDGPDDRDFEIVKGDIYKDIEFKKEVEVEEPKEMMSQPVKEEPYEEVMKQRELKGLASLVSSDEVGGDFTKKQKEILEKLKGQGYLFKRPVEDSNYKKTKVNSSEFTESFHVWKKQD
tara:strand:- start:244 stop:1689 length:1446 start_codon:yes stop_codon:yes gene_type:complete